MRRWFALGAVVLQVLVVAFMAGQREWVLHFGRPILLRSAPVDPNDPMRGYYARFNYDISSVPASLWRDGLPAKLVGDNFHYRKSRDLRVYASLRVNEAGIGELVSLSDRAPAAGLFVQGRLDSVTGDSAMVRYGIEALFMEQGKSKKLEDDRRTERLGAPIDAEVTIGGSALAVLSGYRWEPLGLVGTFERAPVPPAAPAAGGARPQRTAQPAVTAVKLELKNYGPDPVAIVDLPNGGSFRLVAGNPGQEDRYRWVGETREVAPKPDATHVIVLKPGESHTTRIDLTRPEWFVVDTKAAPDQQKPVALRDLTEAWAASFRIEYAPPPKERVTGLPHTELIRFGRLLTRRFNPTANLD